MKKKTAIGLLAGACLLASTFPLTAAEAGKGYGGGQMRGAGLQNQTQSQTRQQLRDGSCGGTAQTQAGSRSMKGNAYGPNDGTGNQGNRPQDGTGYGPGPR